MIDTDATGNKKMIELILNEDSHDWTEYEHKFIAALKFQTLYRNLSDKQKSLVGRLYDQLIGR